MHIIEAAKSSRSKCKACKEKIEQGELRFGFYDDHWDSFKWHHLACGAGFDRDAFQSAVDDFDGEIENLEQILEDAKTAMKGKSMPRAEPAPSARAACKHCGEKIEPKGALRVVVPIEVEGFGKSAGFVHPGCATDFTEAEDPDAFLAKIIENSLITDEQVVELEGAF